MVSNETGCRVAGHGVLLRYRLVFDLPRRFTARFRRAMVALHQSISDLGS